MSDNLDFRGATPPGMSLRKRVGQRLMTGLWLLVVWVAIRGSVTPASIIGGTLVITALMVLFRRGLPSTTSQHTIHPWWVIRYVAHFVYELLKANIEVAMAVIFPSRIEHKRAIIGVPLPRSSRLVGALLANAVSLTPGTSIIEVSNDPPSFHVHVLNMTSADEIRSSIAELHWRLVRALGPDEARAAVEADAAELRQRVADAERADTRAQSDAADGIAGTRANTDEPFDGLPGSTGRSGK